MTGTASSNVMLFGAIVAGFAARIAFVIKSESVPIFCIGMAAFAGFLGIVLWRFCISMTGLTFFNTWMIVLNRFPVFDIFVAQDTLGWVIGVNFVRFTGRVFYFFRMARTTFKNASMIEGGWIPAF